MMQNDRYQYPDVSFISIMLTMLLFEIDEIEKQCFRLCMNIRGYCIYWSIYTVFIQDLYGSFTEYIRLNRLTHTDLSVYTYICVALNVRTCLLKPLFVFFYASFFARIFVRIYVSICQTDGCNFSLRYFHSSLHSYANNAISAV